MNLLFRDKELSYGAVFALGLLAGALVVFLWELPGDGLWAFSDWSSSTYGFWMFSTSLLVLSGKTRRAAVLRAALYIFPMFLATTVGVSLHLFRAGIAPFNSLAELVRSHAGGWLLYSVPPAVLCSALAAVLWEGRRTDRRMGRLLRLLPAGFLLAETLALFSRVFTARTGLFSALTDLACLAAYLLIVRPFRPSSPPERGPD